jgi:hypothetical protein
MSLIEIVQQIQKSDNLKWKKELVCYLNGFEDINKLELWRSKNQEDILKPQWFHSAIGIYLLLKYPQLRKKDSFMNYVTENNIEEIILKVVIDILKEDEEGLFFMENSDKFIPSVNLIIDKHNQGSIELNHDNDTIKLNYNKPILSRGIFYSFCTISAIILILFTMRHIFK